MERSKILSLIGLATKAGRTKSGEFAVEKSISSRSSRLVFVSEEVSPGTRKSFIDKCNHHKIPVVICFSKEELGKACGKDVRTSLSVEDDGFAGALLKLVDHSMNGGC